MCLPTGSCSIGDDGKREVMMPRFLHGDDDADWQRYVSAFMRHEGYEGDSVSSGEDLLERLAEGTYDVVITDNIYDETMNKMSGLDVLEKIRENEKWANVPVIVLSGSDIEDIVEKMGGLFAGKTLFRGALVRCLERIRIK